MAWYDKLFFLFNFFFSIYIYVWLLLPFGLSIKKVSEPEIVTIFFWIYSSDQCPCRFHCTIVRPHFSIPLYPCRRIFTFFDLSNFLPLQTKEKINRFEDRIDTRYTKREEDIFFIIFLETISMERLIRSNSASLSNRQLLVTPVPRSLASILHAGRTPALSFSLSICKKMKKEKRRRQRLRTGSGAIEEVVRVIFARASFFEAENPSGKRRGGRERSREKERSLAFQPSLVWIIR